MAKIVESDRLGLGALQQLAEHLADVVGRRERPLVVCEEMLFRPPVGLAKEQVIADGDVGRVTVGQTRSEGKVGLL